MKATTLFALTIALVLGLGAAATAKYFGLLDPKAAAATPPPPPPPPPTILVAGTNLFKGHALSAADVRVRPARPEEVADYNANQKDYLPAVVNAANFRVMAEHVEADRPLKVKHFEPQEFDNLEKRIAPYMRAVHLDVPKVRCAGGLLQRDDRVDVLLTTNVQTGSVGGVPESPATLRTAVIARDCRIVTKRNSLLTAILPNPDAVPFTLEANPYRAGLIAFAEQKGLITLVPRSKAKPDGMSVPAAAKPTFADEMSEEYKDEDERVQKVENLEYTVSDADLMRILKLQPIPTRTPPAPPTKVVTIKGTGETVEQLFGPDGRPLPVKKDQFGQPIPAGVDGLPTSAYEPKTYYFQKPEDAAAAAGKGPGGVGSIAPPRPVSVDFPTNNPNLLKKPKEGL
jgi:Flp pilus assembly protein CpaB